MDIKQLNHYIANLNKLDQDLNRLHSRLQEIFPDVKDTGSPKDIDPKTKEILEKSFW